MTNVRGDAVGWIVGALCLGVFGWQVAQPGLSSSDTGELLVGVGAADACLHAHVFSNCNAAGFGDVSHFPLLQYIPALIMKRLGAHIDDANHGLILLNAGAFLGLLALLWHAGRRLGGAPVGALLLLAGITSPLLWYSHASFSEALAAFAMALFVAGLALRWPPVIAALGLLLAALAKEPNIVVLLSLGALVVAARPRKERWSLSELVALGIAAVVAVGLSAGFNVFRYGTVRNPYYLDAGLDPALPDRASAFAGMFVAPNVGLLWFWPCAIAIAVLAVTGSSGRARRVAWLVLGLFALMVVGYANFFGPFGWEAWGPRHVLPWVPAFLIALASVARERLHDALPRPAVAAAALLVVAALAIPQVAVFRDPLLGVALFEPGPACPLHLPDVSAYRSVPGGSATYFECARKQAWTASPTLAHAAARLDRAGTVWALLLTAAIAVLGTRAATGRSLAGRSAIIRG